MSGKVRPQGAAGLQPGKVAIVTAAGRGIGAACARELAAQGWRLALMSRSGDAAELARELNGIGTTGSVSEEADLRALVERTLAEYGRIDGVVNNTGHPARGGLLEISDDDWHRGLDLLLLNVVRMARLVTPVMRRQSGGAIVNISSFTAFEPSPDYPLSSAFRAALGGVAKMYADRHAAEGIRMNNVLPGFVGDYPLNGDALARIPMERTAAPEEIARTVAFLLSPGAGYLTGQNIRVDGGLTRHV